MNEPITFYMVMAVRKWENITLQGQTTKVEFHPWLGDGFCRVFYSYEEAVLHADGETVVCVQGRVSPVAGKDTLC